VYASTPDAVFAFGAARKLREVAHLSLVEIALPCIEFGGKTAHVAWQVAPTRTPRDGRKANKNRSLVANALQKVGLGVLAQRLRELEEPVGAGAARIVDCSIALSQQSFAECRATPQFL
jgi:hypothetical protein